MVFEEQPHQSRRRRRRPAAASMAAVAGVVAWGVTLVLDPITGAAIESSSSALKRMFAGAVEIGLVGLVFGVIYVGIAHAMHVREVRQVGDMVRSGPVADRPLTGRRTSVPRGGAPGSGGRGRGGGLWQQFAARPGPQGHLPCGRSQTAYRRCDGATPAGPAG